MSITFAIDSGDITVYYLLSSAAKHELAPSDVVQEYQERSPTLRTQTSHRYITTTVKPCIDLIPDPMKSLYLVSEISHVFLSTFPSIAGIYSADKNALKLWAPASVPEFALSGRGIFPVVQVCFVGINLPEVSGALRVTVRSGKMHSGTGKGTITRWNANKRKTRGEESSLWMGAIPKFNNNRTTSCKFLISVKMGHPLQTQHL
ncbi:hypothetical protein BT69DRAFT_1305762 [Atractiella rhizophila]|nr:hypothetical protein BT69DRAFT_1305762 [Atractiella rhizophila]